MHPLCTALLNKHAHIANFWLNLLVIPCLCARLPFLLRQENEKYVKCSLSGCYHSLD